MEANLNSSATTVQEDYAAHTPRDVVRGARILCEALLHEGVDTIFGYPGGAVLPIYDELAKMRGHLRHILARHEQGAVHMAEGYAKATGKVGVVLVTSGPGATNAVTGIANAYMDSTPLVVFTGQVQRAMAKIGTAKRPILYVGGGVIHSGGTDELVELAERLGLPVTPTLMGLGCFPSGHPLSLGMLGMHGSYWANMAISESDLI